MDWLSTLCCRIYNFHRGMRFLKMETYGTYMTLHSSNALPEVLGESASFDVILCVRVHASARVCGLRKCAKTLPRGYVAKQIGRMKEQVAGVVSAGGYRSKRD